MKYLLSVLIFIGCKNGADKNPENDSLYKGGEVDTSIDTSAFKHLPPLRDTIIIHDTTYIKE